MDRLKVSNLDKKYRRMDDAQDSVDNLNNKKIYVLQRTPNK